MRKLIEHHVQAREFQDLAAFPLFLPAGEALARLKRPAQAAFFAATALVSGCYAGYALFVVGIP